MAMPDATPSGPGKTMVSEGVTYRSLNGRWVLSVSAAATRACSCRLRVLIEGLYKAELAVAVVKKKGRSGYLNCPFLLAHGQVVVRTRLRREKRKRLECQILEERESSGWQERFGLFMNKC
jgi:hypothetical protein